jgi:ketosteroid isomerase-like protein
MTVLLQGAMPATAADTDALLRLERTWNEAHLHTDAAALERLWADDFVVIVPRMEVITRAAAVAMARSGRLRFERYETSGVEARIYGATGVVTGRLQRTRRMNDTLVHDDWQFTKIYIRSGDGWKVVLFQASERPEPDDPAKAR